ncbi:hypothetical protein BH23VER1_BH23VER1_07250 [soil metagenome]
MLRGGLAGGSPFARGLRCAPVTGAATLPSRASPAGKWAAARRTQILQPALKHSVHPDVLREDLAEIYERISEDHPRVAEEFLDTFEGVVGRLCEFPLLGVAYPLAHPMADGLRMCLIGRFRNFLLFYKVEGEELRVLYVTHGARDIPSLVDERERL